MQPPALQNQEMVQPKCTTFFLKKGINCLFAAHRAVRVQIDDIKLFQRISVVVHEHTGVSGVNGNSGRQRDTAK